jgi:hypothetical protein
VGGQGRRGNVGLARRSVQENVDILEARHVLDDGNSDARITQNMR